MLHVSIDGSGLFAKRIAPRRAELSARDAEIGKDFLEQEIRRVGASAAEIGDAFAMVAEPTALDPRAYAILTPRMRRLVDLAIVAGSSLSAADFDQDMQVLTIPTDDNGQWAAVGMTAEKSVGLTAPASG